jgi:hypothetical protein
MIGIEKWRSWQTRDGPTGSAGRQESKAPMGPRLSQTGTGKTLGAWASACAGRPVDGPCCTPELLMTVRRYPTRTGPQTCPWTDSGVLPRVLRAIQSRFFQCP